MKKNLYTYLIVLLSSITTYAQISIEMSDLPSANKNVTIANGAAGSVDFGEASNQAQVWDFTQVQTFAISEINYADPSDLQGANDYPNSTVARVGGLLDVLGPSLGDLFPLPVDLPDANAFYSPTNNGLEFEGLFTDLNIPGILNGEEGTFDVNPTYKIFPTGTYNDQAITEGAAILLNAPIDTNVLALLGDQINLDSLGLGGLDLSLVDAGILVEIDAVNTFDAFGTANFPNDVSFEVLRSTENLDIRLSVGAYIDIPFIGPTEIYNLIDTNITAVQTKLWAKEVGHPIASTLSLDGQSSLNLEVIFIPTPLVADFDAVVNNMNVSLTSLSTGDISTLSWDMGDGNTQTGDLVNYTYELPGNYDITLTVTDLQGNTQTITQTVTVEYPTSINDLTDEVINIYPNPAVENVFVEMNNSEETIISIYNLNGKLIHQRKVISTGIIDISNFPTALYQVVINNGSKQHIKTIMVK